MSCRIYVHRQALVSHGYVIDSILTFSGQFIGSVDTFCISHWRLFTFYEMQDFPFDINA